MLCSILLRGYGFAVGIFHQYWTHVLFPGPEATGTVTAAATLLTGLMYMSAVAFGPLITRYPEYRRNLQLLGLSSSVLGIILSGFAKKPWHLICTAGMLYPIGGGRLLLASPLSRDSLLNHGHMSRSGIPPSCDALI